MRAMSTRSSPIVAVEIPPF